MNKMQTAATPTNENISPEQATALLLDNVQPPATERLNLSDCQDRLLAERIEARFSIPNFAKSPYDGYALRHDDVRLASKDKPIRLSIVEDIPVGQAPTVHLEAGQCAQIATGVMLPMGADGIVPIERVQVFEHAIFVGQPITAGSNIIPVGDDIARGQTLLEVGSRLSPAALALLASQGIKDDLVYKKPVVGFFATGSELVDIGGGLSPVKSTIPMLS